MEYARFMGLSDLALKHLETNGFRSQWPNQTHPGHGPEPVASSRLYRGPLRTSKSFRAVHQTSSSPTSNDQRGCWYGLVIEVGTCMHPLTIQSWRDNPNKGQSIATKPETSFNRIQIWSNVKSGLIYTIMLMNALPSPKICQYYFPLGPKIPSQ